MHSIRSKAMSRCVLAICVAIASSEIAPAQRTWIVDAANGAGTDFTDLPPALTAAADGDTILVRAGTYAVGTTGKALRMVGIGTPVIRAATQREAFIVRGLPAGRTFVMQGFALDGQPRVSPFDPPPEAPLQIDQCQGLVHLAAITIQEPKTFLSVIEVEQSAAVTMLDCQLMPGLLATDARVSAVACTFLGTDTSSGVVTPGLFATRSIVELSQSTATGGNATGHSFAHPAVRMIQSILIVRGDSASSYRGGMHGVQEPALAGDLGSGLLLDPSVSLTGGVAGFGLRVTRRLPSLQVAGGALGTAIDVELYSPDKDPFALIAGWPTQPVIVPPYGERWLSLPATVLAVGVQGSTEHWKSSWPVPADPRLVGLALGMQAISGPANAIELSNAGVVVVH